MTKLDKAYRIVSIVYFAVHSLLFVFVAAVGFLPFHENKNYYEAFSGFFGDVLPKAHPILILMLLFFSCICAFLTIKKPHLSMLTAILTFSFFLLVFLLAAFEAAFVSLFSRFGEINMSTYHIGFNLMSHAADVTTYLDPVFIIYAFVTTVIQDKRKQRC